MQHYPRRSTSDDDYDNQILDKWFSSLKHFIFVKTDNWNRVQKNLKKYWPSKVKVINRAVKAKVAPLTNYTLLAGAIILAT